MQATTSTRAADVETSRLRALDRLREAQALCAAHPQASFENIWHTLVLLDEPPIERLNRSLTRGRYVALHR